MLGACSHSAASGFSHLHQCHHCPRPLGSLARGKHGGLPGILQVYPYVCCIQVVFNIYINIYQKPIIYFYIVCILYSWKQCLSIVLFWYILFLSGAVYSFKQKKMTQKIVAACAEGCHLNCLGPSLFSLSHLAVPHSSFSFLTVRTEDAQVLKTNTR